MTLKAFKACFEVLFKLYDGLNSDYELTIREKEKTLLFFNTLSAEQCNVFVQQQNSTTRSQWMNLWNSSRSVTQ